MNKCKLITGIVAFVAILVIGLSFRSSTSAEQLRLEAGKARIEAMQNDCKTIVKRISACFTSKDKSECAQMQDSYAWFISEYSESPDFACTTVPDPLVFGAEKK